MILDYAGARGRITREKAARLPSGWVVQPKIDGTYCRIHLDARGRVSALFTRSGELRGELVRPFLGARIGAPHAQLVGELEAWTESANRLSETRGYRMIHLFDCVRDGRRYLAREPYGVRRDALYRMRAAVQDETPGRDWGRDANGTAHHTKTGRFCAESARDWGLCSIVEQRPARATDNAWADWVARIGGEGLVCVNVNAPIGARRAKLKIKEAHTIDAVVLSTDAKRAYLQWAGQVFAVGTGKRDLKAGQVVEILCDGFYEVATIPKFPRFVRVRKDK